jgi:hypothetical protein
LKICYRSESQDPVLNSASVSPTSKVGIATVLVLLVLGNYKVRRSVVFNGIIVIPSFMKISEVVHNLLVEGRGMDVMISVSLEQNLS